MTFEEDGVQSSELAVDQISSFTKTPGQKVRSRFERLHTLAYMSKLFVAILLYYLTLLAYENCITFGRFESKEAHKTSRFDMHPV